MKPINKKEVVKLPWIIRFINEEGQLITGWLDLHPSIIDRNKAIPIYLIELRSTVNIHPTYFVLTKTFRINRNPHYEE